ncbi:MAG: M18 family aminopeptidase [Proteobacteria bacterium]|nr:M18 family aminopeptidase [Pseudomonadota bacterium]
MPHITFTTDLLDFIAGAPTAFHAVSSVSDILADRGFIEIQESSPWQPLSPGSYFVRRNDSSLIALTLTDEKPALTGLRMAGAHTDSPGLKLKPIPGRINHSYLQFGVEVYGGALLAPWFDRDLSLAGRVTWQDQDGAIGSSLIDFRRPIGVIPSLAIHLDREVNKNRSINKQTDLVPIVMLMEEDRLPDLNTILLEQLARQYPAIRPSIVTDHELFFYDSQPPAFVGLQNEFIAGSRLDNLLSCYALIQAMLDSRTRQNSLVVLNDHEETGSLSGTGARGPFLQSVLERLMPEINDRRCCLSRSLFISVDNAHGVHPNFAGKHDQNHRPLLNCGPVIKHNANQHYATTSRTASYFRRLCQRAAVPVQDFVMRNDLACGSTIGPITAGELGVEVVDVGVPSLAMHSIREMTGSRDGWYVYNALKEFFSSAGTDDGWPGSDRQ